MGAAYRAAPIRGALPAALLPADRNALVVRHGPGQPVGDTITRADLADRRWPCSLNSTYDRHSRSVVAGAQIAELCADGSDSAMCRIPCIAAARRALFGQFITSPAFQPSWASTARYRSVPWIFYADRRVRGERPQLPHRARRLRRDPASVGRPFTRSVGGHLAQHRTPDRPDRTEYSGRDPLLQVTTTVRDKARRAAVMYAERSVVV